MRKLVIGWSALLFLRYLTVAKPETLAYLNFEPDASFVDLWSSDGIR